MKRINTALVTFQFYAVLVLNLVIPQVFKLFVPHLVIFPLFAILLLNLMILDR